MSNPLKNTMKSMDDACKGNPHYQPIDTAIITQDRIYSSHMLLLDPTIVPTHQNRISQYSSESFIPTPAQANSASFGTFFPSQLRLLMTRRSTEDFLQFNLSYISSLINIDNQSCSTYTCRRCTACHWILNDRANALEDHLTTHTRDFRRFNTEYQRRISFLAYFQDYCYVLRELYIISDSP